MRLPSILVTTAPVAVPSSSSSSSSSLPLPGITVSSPEDTPYEERQISVSEFEENLPTITLTAPEVGAVPFIIVTDDDKDDSSTCSQRLGSEASDSAELSRSSSATSLDEVVGKEGVIRTIENTVPYNGPLGRGSLTTLAVLAEYEESSCCKFLGCSFEFEFGGEEIRTIGELGALIVDKSDTGLFVEELLLEWEGEGGKNECSRMMRTLFTGEGNMRAEFEGNGVVALEDERLCYIDHSSLLKAYKGRGLGRLALRSVHRILAQIGFSGPVVLSPATPAEVEEGIKGHGLTAAQREEKLVRFYRACGMMSFLKERGGGREGGLLFWGGVSELLLYLNPI